MSRARTSSTTTFAAQVDSVADEIAGSVVDAIETPEGKHT